MHRDPPDRQILQRFVQKRAHAPVAAAGGWPKLTIVTPSFNQAAFLERTILSVLNQNYPNLEFIVIDGGSTDGSAELLRRYDADITHWVSEPDEGQAQAINKGLARATGEWIGWQNSDDLYLPGAFHGLARAIRRYPDATLLSANGLLIGPEDEILRDMRFVRPTEEAMLAEGMLLTNQAAFWHRDLQRKVGLLDANYPHAFDYDWFLRLVRAGRCRHVREFWGALRVHGETKTHRAWDLYQQEKQVIRAGRVPGPWLRRALVARRALSMALGGEFGYLWRGLRERFGGDRPARWYDAYIRR